jgi:hypothetical protein
MTELFAEEAPGTAFTLPGDEVHDLVRSLVSASASSPGESAGLTDVQLRQKAALG